MTTPAGGALTERVRVDEDGNVGIGTTQPTAPLDVHSNLAASSAGDVATVGDENSSAAWTFRRSTQDYLFLRGFNSAGTETIRLDPSGNATFLDAGNVGIGTTSPDTKLHVNGGVTLDEMTSDPSTPAASTAVLFLREKEDAPTTMALVIKWKSGQESVLAVDPT